MLTGKLHDNTFKDRKTVCFSPRQCLRSRYNKNECDSCLHECQAGALTLDGRTVTFDQDKCTGCMRCVPACPNDAFDDRVDIPGLLENLLNQSVQTLTCRKNWHSQSHYSVPCIGLFSEPVLAVILLLAQENITFDSSRCPDCENGHALGSFQKKMHNLATREKDMGQKVNTKFHLKKNSISAPDKRAERRTLLRFYHKTIIDLSRKAVQIKMADETNSKKSAEKKPARNSIALQFGLDNIENDSDKKTLLSYLFSVDADKHCDCCPACHGMCPTGALRRVQGKTTKILTFTSSNCSGCGICSDFCNKKALTVTEGFSKDPKKHIRIV